MAFRASSATTATYNSSADFTISKPVAIQDGDIMIVAAASDSVHAIVGANIPAGWAQIGTTQNAPNTDSSTSVFWKVAESSDPASFAFTGIFTTVETGIAAIVAWSGRDPASPIDAFDQSATTGTTHESDAIVPSQNNCDIVYIMGSDPPAGQSGTADASPAATERVDAINGTSGYLFIQDYAQATAASVSLGMTLTTSDDGATFIIALAPASTGIDVPFISSATTVNAPTLVNQQIDAPFIASGTVVHAPTVSAFGIAPPFIAASTTVFAPTLVNQQITVPFIPSGTTVLAPTLEAVVPRAGVQIAFDDTLLTVNPAWVRIDQTVKVSRWEIRRGRQSELEKTGTAEATIFVNDVDGHFDPANAGSPWFGKLDGKQVSLSRWNPVTDTWNPRFRGYIEEYGYDLAPSQVKTEVAIRCVGFMDYLAGAEMAPGQAGSTPPAGSEGNIFYEDAEVDDRMLAILADAQFPTSLAVIFSGNIVMQESIYDPGYSFLAALQDAADAEFPGVANIYEDRYGRIVFHGRHARFDPDAVALEAGTEAWDFQRWSAGDAAGIVIDPDAAQVRPPVNYDRSLKLVINAALATPLGIAEEDIEAQLATDPTSIGLYGIRSWSAPDLRILEHKTNGNTGLQETKLMADYYVTNYAEPRTRPRQITLKPLLPTDPRAAATWELMCEVDISDIVYLYITSPGGGGVDGEFYVEGITETARIGNPDFEFGEVTLDVSPTAYYQTDVFND
jgi:hypothetical protein